MLCIFSIPSTKPVNLTHTHVTHTNVAVSCDTVASMHKLYFSFKPKNIAGYHFISLNMLFNIEVTSYLSVKILFHSSSVLCLLDCYLGSYYNFYLGAITCNYVSRTGNIFLLLAMMGFHSIL